MKKKTIAFGGLLLAVAITGYSVSGTYAKYISNIDFTDEARVAKWEFNLKNNSTNKAYTIDLFKDSYEILSADGKGTGKSKVVSSEPGVKVVAPGTSGQYEVQIDGTAETNYTIAYENIKVENTIQIKDSKGKVVYNPIKFQINNNGKELTSEQLAAEIKKLSKPTTVYPANYTLNDANKVGFTISWKWDFEKAITDDSTDAEKKAAEQQDAWDTQLAKQQGTVKVSLDLVVTQSDKPATASIKNNANTIQFADLNNSKFKTEIATLKSDWGYDLTKVEDVVFNGKTLTGTIVKNENYDKSKWPVADQTGYYYAVGITGSQEANIELKENGKYKQPVHTNANGIETLIFALNPNAKVKVINYRVNGVEYTLDYSELNFN